MLLSDQISWFSWLADEVMRMRSCESRLQLQLQGPELEESVPGKKHLRSACVRVCVCVWCGGFNLPAGICVQEMGRQRVGAAVILECLSLRGVEWSMMQVLQFRVEMEYVAAAVEGGGWGEPKTKLR